MLYEVITEKHTSKNMAGPSFSAELDQQDRQILADWLVSQRLAISPDEDIWKKILLGSKPFFNDEFENLVLGKWSRLLRVNATPLEILAKQELVEEFLV